VSETVVTVVGAGLAGCEAALQLASRGIRVHLLDQKPLKRTPAQTSDAFCELVCSNSMRGAALVNAVGLLKEEMRRAGSFVIATADRTAVPAGGALAVDRDLFAAEMTRQVSTHPNITVEAREVTDFPEGRPTILATGPLTGDALAAKLEALVGRKHLAYYDAIAPILAADSIDHGKVWKQSRWGKGVPVADATAVFDALAHDTNAAAQAGATAADGATDGGDRDAEATGDEAYINCPLDEAQYLAFVRALVEADPLAPRAFEDVKYFEGCLPIEVMAKRGEKTLSFGPMKPVGLVDPRTGRRPYAVIQLRPEDGAATAYNMVGFQTRLRHADQLRIFRSVPGLEEAEFLRLGSVHRNTFVDAPVLLDEDMQLRAAPGLYLAGQVAGVEGYVESAAAGMLCAILLAQKLQGASRSAPPPTTALGGILTHLSRTPLHGHAYQPSNLTWAQIPPLADADRRLKKRARYERMAERALVDLEGWLVGLGPRGAGGTAAA
jgi:methylenetetrahydrofolate--tRNA-(uracil-5-)-methyltransferase